MKVAKSEQCRGIFLIHVCSSRGGDWQKENLALLVWEFSDQATGTLVLLDPPQRTENCLLPVLYFVVPALVRLFIYGYEYSFELS